MSALRKQNKIIKSGGGGQRGEKAAVKLQLDLFQPASATTFLASLYFMEAALPVQPLSSSQLGCQHLGGLEFAEKQDPEGLKKLLSSNLHLHHNFFV